MERIDYNAQWAEFRRRKRQHRLAFLLPIPLLIWLIFDGQERPTVDAMDLAYSKEHIDTFVVVSGDSDFSPLVSKLKENGKHVIGLGMQESTSDLLRDNCDEFIY